MSSNPTLRSFLVVAAVTCAIALLCIAVGLSIRPRAERVDPSASALSSAGRTISITGTSVVKATPDRAEISMTVVTTDRDAIVAQKKNSALTKAVLAAAKASGVSSSAVSPGGFELSDSEVYDEKAKKYFTTYSVSTDVILNVTDLNRVGEVLDAAVEAGANRGKVEFKTDKLREYRDKARVLAIKAAREKAALMSEAAGVTIDKVLTFQEVSPDSYYWRGGSANQTQNVVQVQSAPIEVPVGMDSQFGGGTVDVSISVNIDFSLK